MPLVADGVTALTAWLEEGYSYRHGRSVYTGTGGMAAIADWPHLSHTLLVRVPVVAGVLVVLEVVSAVPVPLVLLLLPPRAFSLREFGRMLPLGRSAAF